MKKKLIIIGLITIVSIILISLLVAELYAATSTYELQAETEATKPNTNTHGSNKIKVGLYKVFEKSIKNNKEYANKFKDVELNCTYTSPSGKVTKFYGFFDGDGSGGGDKSVGDVWKLRFMPDEVGKWKYKWTWSDNTVGGEEYFICTSASAGKGVLRPYEDNPRWLSYNGTDPVWLKSYYESGAGSIGQPLDWLAENVYQPMIDRGYNHFQVNWLLSLCCFREYYHDGPALSNDDLTLYQDGEVTSTMRFDVWEMIEQNVSWLNDRNIGIHMFIGFDGSRNGGPAWTNLSDDEQDFYVRYVISRLAPFANIAGWNYVWEVPGNREEQELGWARLVEKYDVFDHLLTYQDETPKNNEFDRPEYNFAAIENHLIYSQDRDTDRAYWNEAWTHHEACLAGYVSGKPAYMMEGNALWRRYWFIKTGASQDELRQSAWGCATAGASFNWCGHVGGSTMTVYGPEGLPFHNDGNPYESSAKEIDILSDVMNKEITFYRMNPSDSLLSNHDNESVWCLSEPGEQYLVFSAEGNKFELQLKAGRYKRNKWINTKTGASISVKGIKVSNDEHVKFTPPDSSSDWVLIIRN
ncbi:MAG: DUF5060 domain-containing protein [Clostridiales bacterium]